MRSCLSLPLVGALVALPVTVMAADVKVTDHTYVRHDGGSDSVITSCSSDATTPETGGDAGGNRQQNEPTVAVKPGETTFIVASANDYCTVPTTTDAWQGLYVSPDGGVTWVNSLLPGYPGDTSTAGAASPLQTNSGDPLLAWDNDEHLFVAGISFNRTQTRAAGPVTPSNGHFYVARYTRNAAAPLGISFDGVVIVGEGTPGQFPFAGRFNDKPSMRVDTWADSPNEGNVYAAWTLFPGYAGSDQIVFARSTDSGATFSKPIKISRGVASAQGSTIAVQPDGDVYVFWRQYGSTSVGPDAIVFVTSVDGGQHFSDPAPVSEIVPYESFDQYASGGTARDCGDGGDLCVSNFVFARNGTSPTAVSDDAGNLYVTWEELVPITSNGDTYRPDGQSQVVIAKSINGGTSWSKNPVDPESSGHQFFPSIAYNKELGELAVIYYDSRFDPAYSPVRPIGNTATGTSSGTSVLDTYVAISNNGGVSWARTVVSTQGQQPQYETFDDRQVPFFGDYIGIDAVGATTFGVWTDNRDILTGADPRETVQDGFDVWQCRVQNTDGTWGSDQCPNAGGLNANIYGAHP
jgi:hypothetical protein